MDSIYEALVTLGSPIVRSGKYYRTKALYRGGDNPTALSIHRDTGRFFDFSAQKGGTWDDFLKLALGNDTKKIDNFKVNNYTPLEFIQKNSIEYMKYKVYSDDVLKRLLPLFDFYIKKGIKPHTLKLFEAGLATNGTMCNRIIFPIRNTDAKIIGFAGRLVVKNDKYPKWLIKGPKNYFCYPIHLNASLILEKREVILVESIGDLLALWEQGIRNVWCTFGLNIGSEVLKQLIAANPTKIIIAFNNDFESKINRGGVAAEKAVQKLSDYFDKNHLFIKLPPAKDFGESSKEQIEEWYKNICQKKKQ